MCGLVSSFFVFFAAGVVVIGLYVKLTSLEAIPNKCKAVVWRLLIVEILIFLKKLEIADS